MSMPGGANRTLIPSGRHDNYGFRRAASNEPKNQLPKETVEGAVQSLLAERALTPALEF
jgi:hypothetical protein